MYKLCIVKISEFVKIHLSNKSQNKESWKLTGLVDEPLNHSTKLGEKMKLWKLHKWIYPKTNNWAQGNKFNNNYQWIRTTVARWGKCNRWLYESRWD